MHLRATDYMIEEAQYNMQNCGSITGQLNNTPLQKQGNSILPGSILNFKTPSTRDRIRVVPTSSLVSSCEQGLNYHVLSSKQLYWKLLAC